MRHPFGLAVFTCLLIYSATRAPAVTTLPATGEVRGRLEAIRGRLPAFKQRIDALRAAGQDVSYPRVTYTVLENFTPPALEDLAVAAPSSWGITGVNGYRLSYESVKEAHTGAWAAKLVGKDPRRPNIYGMFENAAVIKLEEGKPYTLSAWTRSDGEPGSVSIPLDNGWGNRMAVPATAGRWKRVSKTFTPGPADLAFKLRVLVEDAGSGLLLDDVCLVAGSEAEAGKNLIPNPSFEISWNQQRVARELPDMEKMADRLDAQLRRAAGGEKLPAVPRWTGSERPTIHGPSFIAPARAGAAAPAARPIFFVGYGHFAQVRNDVEKFPGYGINIVQHAEFGPREVYPKEGQTDDAAIDHLIDELDRAAKVGVAVDWLLSPHYVPDWLFAKYPELRKGRADFFPYSIYAPQGRQLVEDFIRYVVPKIKDKPALLSICLSNEPINVQEPDAYSVASWRAWLKKRHGDIAALNERWGTKYAKFDDVPQPNPMGKSAEPRPGPAWWDFCRWNEESFAEFHKLLANAVHSVAPNVPVHLKVTTWHLYRPDEVQTGDDPTLLDAVGQINGNDSVNLWGFDERSGDSIERGGKDFAQGWRENALGYELQRSTHDAPVFNSENHLVFDREQRYVDPAHVRAALWMGAVHGQSATTLWVWEREKSNPNSDLAGNIMERPSCAEAVGLVNHDLNRVAPEITAIQNAKPDVLILQDDSAAVWDAKKYGGALMKTFTALSFTGAKIGFLTELQLEQGKVADAPLLIVPAVTHLSDAAFAGLKTFKGKVLFAGGNGFWLTKNEYDQPRPERLPQAALLEPLTPMPKAWQEAVEPLRLKLAEAGVTPAVKVVDAKGQPQSAVQWQLATTPRGTVVNLYNAANDAATVVVTPAAKLVDLLTGETVPAGQPITLRPMDVRLMQVAR